MPDPVTFIDVKTGKPLEEDPPSGGLSWFWFLADRWRRAHGRPPAGYVVVERVPEQPSPFEAEVGPMNWLLPVGPSLLDRPWSRDDEESPES